MLEEMREPGLARFDLVAGSRLHGNLDADEVRKSRRDDDDLEAVGERPLGGLEREDVGRRGPRLRSRREREGERGPTARDGDVSLPRGHGFPGGEPGTIRFYIRPSHPQAPDRWQVPLEWNSSRLHGPAKRRTGLSPENLHVVDCRLHEARVRRVGRFDANRIVWPANAFRLTLAADQAASSFGRRRALQDHRARRADNRDAQVVGGRGVRERARGSS